MFKAVEDLFDNMHAGADRPMSSSESSTNSLETYVNQEIEREETQAVVEILQEVAEQVTALENTLGGLITKTNEIEIEVEITKKNNSQENCECEAKSGKKITRVTFFHSVIDELVNYFFSCSTRSATVEILLESSESPREVQAPKVEKSISDKKQE